MLRTFALLDSLLYRYPALAAPAYRRYWFASFASVGATQLITLGQGWLVFELTNAPLQLGYLGAAAAIPNVIMTLIGGVIADRFNRRRVMMFTSASTAVLLALLALLDFTEQVQVWHVLAIAAGISLITGLDWPARASILPQLVPRSAFLSAVALNAFIWQVTRMAIPALGGIILALSDTWVVFALGSLGFLIMLIVIATLRIDNVPSTTDSPWQQLRQGLHFIWDTQLFRWLLSLTFVGMFVSNAYIQILPIFADMMGRAEVGYGALLSAGGVGSIMGTLVIGTIRDSHRPGLIMLAGALGSALTVVLFAFAASAQWFYTALFLVFAASAASSVFMIGSMTTMQIKVPDALRGRVMGFHTMGYSMVPLGGLFLGYLSTVTNPTTALLIGNGLFVLAIVVFGYAQISVRGLDRTAFNSEPDAA